MQIFDDKQIDLDLNGPILSFTTNPTGVGSTGVVSGGTGGGSVSLIGIATATFPTSANEAGYVTYRWHEQGIGALSDSTYVTGTATTTLTLSNLITPDDSGRKFFVQADYVPSYYVTGNAINEPLNSGIGTVTVDPLITITTQPSDVSVISGQDAAFIIGASLTNDEDDLTYQWQLDGSDVSNGTVTKSSVITTVSGATTNTLTLNSDDSGITYTVKCVVSSATATNSPLTSDSVTYTPQNVAGFSVVSIEEISPNTSTASTSEVDLSNGAYTFTIAESNPGDDDVVQLYSFFAKEKDLDVEMDLYGGGSSDGSTGEGGYSRIRFTMVQNQEFVIAGLINSINTPYVYRRGGLMASVGEGGKTAEEENDFGGKDFKGRGGAGGGVGVAGGSGILPGMGIGAGGPLIAEGLLSFHGVFGSAFSPSLVYPGDQISSINFTGSVRTGGNGGRALRCTKGVYWAQQGVSPCDDVAAETVAATSKFRLSDGTEVTNSAEIIRGYKAGYNIIQTAGGAIGFGARGGNGTTGGSGGLNASGGGGSGYQDGSVTVVATQLGGSTEAAKVVLRIQS